MGTETTLWRRPKASRGLRAWHKQHAAYSRVWRKAEGAIGTGGPALYVVAAGLAGSWLVTACWQGAEQAWRLPRRLLLSDRLMMLDVSNQQ